MAVERGMYLVRDGELTVPCRLRGRLAKSKSTHNAVCVGDEVEYSLNGDTGVIERLRPRRTCLARRVDAFGRRAGAEQLIVANVDTAVIVMAAAQPPVKTGTIERYLLAAGNGGLEPVLCINKADLDPTAALSAADRYCRQLAVVVTSTVTGEGLDGLRRLLDGRVSVFTGPSGVGKSSLLNALDPDLGLTTGTVSQASGRGTHTTTGVRLYQLPSGGLVVDTPGHRRLELWQTGGPDGSLFPELGAVAARCRYRNCTHTHEPDCAVKEAVLAGDLDRERYRQFVALSGHKAPF